MRWWGCIGILLLLGAASASTPAFAASSSTSSTATTTGAKAAQDTHQTVVDVRPGDARRLRKSDDRGAGMRWIPRTVLFIPRWILTIGFAPIQGLLYLLDRFDLIASMEDLFFNDERTFGLFPTAFFETGFGLNVGVRAVHRDLFGHGERLSLRAGFGGRLRWTAAGAVSTGKLLGPALNISLDGGYDRVPRLRFFGVGNDGDRPIKTSPFDERLDPYDENQVIVESQLSEDRTWVRLQGVLKLNPNLTLRGQTRYRRSSFREPGPRDTTPPSSREVYILDRWIEAGEPVKTLYNELQLTFDNREGTSEYIWPSTPSRGFLITAFGGPNSVLSSAGTTFLRLGGDFQAFFDLWHGDRTLVARCHLEAVTGSSEQVPIIDLPSLGGPELLRGFIRYRFRDRAAAAASLEYRFPIIMNSLGYLFVDAGRVYRSLQEFTLKHLNWGFGGGIQIHTKKTVITRLQLASSSQGGLLFSLMLAPDLSARPQEDR